MVASQCLQTLPKFFITRIKSIFFNMAKKIFYYATFPSYLWSLCQTHFKLYSYWTNYIQLIFHTSLHLHTLFPLPGTPFPISLANSYSFLKNSGSPIWAKLNSHPRNDKKAPTGPSPAFCNHLPHPPAVPVVYAKDFYFVNLLVSRILREALYMRAPKICLLKCEQWCLPLLCISKVWRLHISQPILTYFFSYGKYNSHCVFLLSGRLNGPEEQD